MALPFRKYRRLLKNIITQGVAVKKRHGWIRFRKCLTASLAQLKEQSFL